MAMQRELRGEQVKPQGTTTKKNVFTKWWAKFKGESAEFPDNYSRILKKQNEIIKTGVRTRATVLRVENTGQKINFNPVILLSMRVEAFTSVVVQITSETLIAGIRMPFAGDRICIAFDPDDTSVVVVL